MRHRKKWIAAFLTVAAGFGTYHFWPRDHAEARRLLGALRALIEKEQQNDPPPPTAAQVDGDVQIEVELLVAKINMTDATCGLFANAAKPRPACFMRVASRQRFADILQELRAAQVATVVSEPRIVALKELSTSIVSGSEVPVPIPGKGVAYRNVGVRVAIAAKPASNGRVELELDCEASRLTGMQSLASPQGPINSPLFDSRRFVAHVILGDQETILIGGLAQKGTSAVIFNVPLLSDVRWIGPWFRYSWQRPIDEELIVLATPRVVHPHQPPRKIAKPAK